MFAPRGDHGNPHPSQCVGIGLAGLLLAQLGRLMCRNLPLRRSTTKASRGAKFPSIAKEPAVVIVRSAVSMLSLTRMGMPFKGTGSPVRRARSQASADVSASGVNSKTDLRVGPERSMELIRSRQAWHNEVAFKSPRSNSCSVRAIVRWSSSTCRISSRMVAAGPILSRFPKSALALLAFVLRD
jgi:hypothetical protein